MLNHIWLYDKLEDQQEPIQIELDLPLEHELNIEYEEDEQNKEERGVVIIDICKSSMNILKNAY